MGRKTNGKIKEKRSSSSIEVSKTKTITIVKRKILGFGSGGTVEKITYSDGSNFAIKTTIWAQTEVKILKKLSEYPKCHPNIICLYGPLYNSIGSYSGKPIAFKMEYINGSDLYAHIENTKETKSYYEWVREVFLQLVKAIEYMHSQFVVHRDIKPANIMIEKKTQRVVLIDFDSAEIGENTDAIIHRSEVGTRQYTPPSHFISDFDEDSEGYYEAVDYTFEEAKGHDLYSLGYVLLIMLTRRMDPYKMKDYTWYRETSLKSWMPHKWQKTVDDLKNFVSRGERLRTRPLTGERSPVGRSSNDDTKFIDPLIYATADLLYESYYDIKPVKERFLKKYTLMEEIS